MTMRQISLAACVLAILASFVLSFSTWLALGLLAGFGTLAVALPFCVDGYVVTALTTWLLPGTSDHLARLAKANLYGIGLASVISQAGYHGWLVGAGSPGKAVLAVVVGALPPAVAVAAVHLRARDVRELASETATTDGTGLAVPPQPARPVLPTTAAPTPIAPVVEGATMRTTSAPGLPLTGPVPLQDQSAPHPGAQRFDTVNAHRGGSTSKGNGQVTPVVTSATPAVASTSRQSRQPSPAPTGDLVDLVRPLVGEGLGRQAIATRLEITQHQARQAIATVKSERPTLRAVATGGTR